LAESRFSSERRGGNLYNAWIGSLEKRIVRPAIYSAEASIYVLRAGADLLEQGGADFFI